MFDTIVGGTRRVLDFAGGAGVKKLLLTSSGAVYGRQPSELAHLPEDYLGAPDPLLPGSAYGEGKRVAEHLCAVHADRCGYAVKLARCFAFVGPQLPLDSHYAMGNFIRAALRGDSIRVSGDGTPMRSYLYASDLAIWLWTILFRGRSARAYNVGSAEAVSIAALAGVVNRVLDQNLTVEIVQKNEPGNPISRYVPAVSRAQSELGLKIRIPLDEAIRRTASWHRSA